jgi:hypothetical protein
MKKSRLFFYGIIALPVVSLFFAGSVESQEPPPLAVTDEAICHNVVNLECLEAGTSFDSSVGTLTCFTRINGAQGATTITHVWYFGDEERARVQLDVRSSSWRTYSSKIILPNEIGEWHVDVLGPEGELLKKLQFQISPQVRED